MGKPTGFLEYKRLPARDRLKEERVKDCKEIPVTPPRELVEQEGAMCMDCGIPYCHSVGCPVANLIPEWNDAVYKGQWREAWDRLELTNNLPEVTGRVCPAPCEAACTLAINTEAVSIKKIELAIVEKAFDEGWVIPRAPRFETGRRVAVVGSGPAGLAATQQLRRMGHRVTLFEKADRIGGLLRYGIPDFKLEKHVLDRRILQMELEGVEFETSVTIGEDLSVRYLRNKFEVILLALGAGSPRDLRIPGRGLRGVHFAMEFLTPFNRYVAGDITQEDLISAKNKNVLVIGGGDTGSDCVGTSIRQGAKVVRQIEILPKPMDWHERHNPSWPDWPNIVRTSTSHEEGCERDWCIDSREFNGTNGSVSQVTCSRVRWEKKDPASRPRMIEIEGSEYTTDAELVLLAMGFVHVEHSRLTEELGLEFDGRGSILVDDGCQTTVDGVFAAGDASTGASLVVTAINNGRRAADSIDDYLR